MKILFVDRVVAEAEALSAEEFERASRTLKPPTGEDILELIGVLPELLQKICALVILGKKKLEDLDAEIKKLGKAQSKVITDEVAALILEKDSLKSRVIEIERFAWSVIEGEFSCRVWISIFAFARVGICIICTRIVSDAEEDMGRVNTPSKSSSINSPALPRWAV